jgi:cytoskeletal protein RodZ
MQNVGDRLAEARKRLGIALREASEATKIRTDYLQSMETGSFDFSLPEIYKVGFLKIYARYLKLDADKLAADYATQFSGEGRSDRENLGRMDAPGGHAAGGAAKGRETGSAKDYDAERAKNQTALIKLVAFLVLAVAAIVLLVIGLQYLLEGGASTATTPPSTSAPAPEVTAPAPAQNPTPPAPPAPAMLKITFAATGTITSLQVIQVDGHQTLSSKPLGKGASLVVSSKGPVEIKVSQVQFLTIQVNGGPVQGIADGNHKAYSGALDFDWPP